MNRFAFGQNWLRYLDRFGGPINKESEVERLDSATLSLQSALPDLYGKTFLDVGSGSGLMSAVAQRLGATVRSFDFDPESVKATKLMKLYVGHPEPPWTIEQGSILDAQYLATLGTFDVVYAWGVLHHTGNLWQACKNVSALVGPCGSLYIAIYNDQGWRSRYWKAVKFTYNLAVPLKWLMTLSHLPWFLTCVVYYRIGHRKPKRGMDLWTDYIDWIGGWPFEVASRDAVRKFFEARGFSTTRIIGASSGCNEFVFARKS
jgi:2-polyprenyl-6-hydroxyphenyl methylase/3-demethylubiquinone-9 3-methyltransferase